MARFRFSTGLRNAMRRSSEPDAPVAGIEPAVLANRSRLHRWLIAGLGPPARMARRFLIGELQLGLDTLRTKVDFLLVNLHQKVDAAHEKVDAAHQKVDAAHRKIDDLFKLQQSVMQVAVSMQAGLDDVGLRVRGPLQVDDNTLAFRLADGFVFAPRNDTLLMLMLLDAGAQGLEPGTKKVITALLSPGMTYIDVGAHVGLLTLAAARAVGSTGHVLALEPTPVSYDLLRRMTSVNGIDGWVRTERLAAGARHERTQFYMRTVLGHNSLYKASEADQAIEVELVPLDEMVPAGTKVDVVKIDVEGAELAVLEGMARILRDNPDVALIAEYGPSHLALTKITPHSWFDAFRSHGFAAFRIDEMSGRCTPIAPDSFPQGDSVNVLFVRPGSPAAARIPQ